MRRARSHGEPRQPLDPEINKTLREIKKNKARGVKGASSFSKQQTKVEASPSLGPQDPKAELPLVEEPQDEAQDEFQDRPVTPFIRPSSSPSQFSPSYYFDSSPSFVKVEKTVENQYLVNMAERTLGQLLEHKIQENPGNIVIPNVPNFKLSPSILNVLPIFEGLKNENPYVHLDNLHRKCTALFGNSDNLDNIKLTLFSHTLGDTPRDWLNHLQGGPFRTFNDVAKRFLNRYYPSALTAKLRKEITGITQESGETLQDYYERFVHLCASCPNHNLDETSLIDQFLQGMNDLDARLLQCAAGGSFNNKTPAQVRALIETMAEGNQGRGGRIGGQVNTTSTVDLKAMESRLTANFETRFSQMLKAVGAKIEPKRCEFCGDTTHATDECETLQQDVNAVGNFGGNQGGYQRPQYAYEPWRKNPNLRWRNDETDQQYPQQPRPGLYIHPNAQPQKPQPSQSDQGPSQQTFQPSSSNSQISSLDEKFDKMMALMAGNFTSLSAELGAVKSNVNTLNQNHATTNRQMQNLEMQVKQIAGEVNVLKGQSDNKLPSQGVGPNVKTINAIHLRSGKEIEFPEKEEEVIVRKGVEQEARDKGKEKELELENINAGVNAEEQEKRNKREERVYVPKAPFPSRLAVNKKAEAENDLLAIFKKVEVNIPIVDAIEGFPKIAKFLKDLCTSKRRLKGNERVNLSSVLSLDAKLPPKEKDPGIFAIPCTIGHHQFTRCMLDLGASINVMPRSVYETLDLGNLKETRVTVTLADRSAILPLGVVEDVLVRVNGLVFPADFYILEMGNSADSSSILLGRPFLRTAKTRIDCHLGTMSMEFDNEKISFNVFDAIKYPEDHNVSRISTIDEIDELVEEHQREESLHSLTSFNDSFDEFWENLENANTSEDQVNNDSLGNESDTVLQEVENVELPISEEYGVEEVLSFSGPMTNDLKISGERVPPSIERAPDLELKPLPGHLKYTYLGPNKTLPVIIASNLTPDQEWRLVETLLKYKKAIGWTLADMPGISPATCMHKITLEEGAKPSREAQRRLNPLMMEVVKKELLKLLDAGIIYAVADSEWVSPIHVVPKKTGITIVKNSVGEKVPTRVQNGWRVCIDYRITIPR